MENTERTEAEARRTEVCKTGPYREISAESSAEYVLPDYNEDVRKIIFTAARVNPSGVFADGDELVFSGVIDYNVIYNDQSGEVRSLDFTSDYEFSVKCDHESYIDADANTRIASVYLRPVGPRKLTVRTQLTSDISICKKETVESRGNALSGDGAQLLKESVLVHGRKISEPQEREYAEVLAEADGVNADQVTVLESDADAVITDVRMTEQGVQMKGEVNICAVIMSADAPPFVACKTLPIDEMVTLDGEVPDGYFLRGDATSVSLSVTVNPEDMGYNVTANAVVELRVIADYNESEELIADAYLKECMVESTYEDFSYSQLVDSGMSSFMYETELDRQAVGAEGIREVLCLDGSVRVQSCECKEDKLTIKGEMRFAGASNAVSADGDNSCANIKFTVPFEENVNCNCQIPQNATAYTDVSVGRVKAELDAQKMYISCPVRVNRVITEDKRARYLATCDRRDDLPFSRPESVVTVYYPDAKETLFGIAKRFHTTVRDIAVANSLTESTVSAMGCRGGLSGIKRLVIK